MRRLLPKYGLRTPDEDLSLEAIAEANGIGRTLMENRIQQILSRDVLRRHGFSPEFETFCSRSLR